MVMTGKVIRYDESRGYGFVAPDGGDEDVFLHVNDLTFDKRLLSEGVQVQFSTEEGERGLKASQVMLVGRGGNEKPSGQARHSRTDRRPDRETMTAQALRDELTEVLLLGAPSLTGQQIVEIRKGLIALALTHGWIS
ncbi:cold shock domain-containing protein [Amycolatopsis oliviviridis]|uniref:DNA-binding protein n=1 Tax=Amycolatopsis oliviviridis TaxID=1471590 RepID=A0ABQ3LZU6_9PSEU|nr:cold shock domain-containing protein [Amycolatopsis oliviviridis]GHH28424.1 DNA-binding protein [Amycolatopsis oliviviridis]